MLVETLEVDAMQQTKTGNAPQAGDVLEISPHRVGEGSRLGEILEVLGVPNHPRFRIRWEDGHESIFSPSSDTVIRPRRSPERGRQLMIEELVSQLEHSGLGYRLLRHPRTTSAGEEAAALGVPRAQVAKTLVLVTEDGYVRAVLPASERLDIHKARKLLGDGKATRFASEEELAGAYPMFELGAVPPFGGPAGDRAVVDRRLAEQPSVVVEAGSHTESVRIKTQDLLALTGAELGDICAD
jgi:Ala-tRNA(Pro) deacylase